MKKIALYLIGIFAFLIFTNIDAYACSCFPSGGEPLKQQVNRAKKDSSAVFSGRVLEVVKKPENFQVIVKFQVQSSWKGNVSKQITVTTGLDSAMCGYNFEVGESYLVYTSGANVKTLQTNLCTRTAKLSAAKADTKVLGKAKVLRKGK